MKKILLALVITLLAFSTNAQTTIRPGGATFDDATGTFIGFQNMLTGREERLKLGGQVRSVQTVAPTCTSNCGTSPTVTGTDSAMSVLMGATGSPASGWVITFNGTWTAAPVCSVQMSLAGMVVGKQALTAATTTTTLTVVTNGTAPANADKYAVLCVGLQ